MAECEFEAAPGAWLSAGLTLAVLGTCIAEGLKVFLVALAIIDDLGALLVIAILHTASVRGGRGPGRRRPGSALLGPPRRRSPGADLPAAAGPEAVRSGLATLLDGVSWRHLLGTAFLAGIGFTMAPFISGFAFPGTPFESQAKLTLLLGSLLAAAVGIVVLLTARPIEPDSS